MIGSVHAHLLRMLRTTCTTCACIYGGWWGCISDFFCAFIHILTLLWYVHVDKSESF